MKRGIIAVILLLLLTSITYAQISRDITKIRCGDGVIDDFEMWEEGIELDKCDKMAKLLGIDAAGYSDECVCVPFVKKAFCGNDIREGVEMCDGLSEEDFCPQFGEAIGLELKCNPDTCICEISTGVPDAYDPTQNETEEEEPEGMAVCGDKVLQLKEECDPPNTLCTLPDGSVGICAEGCKCVETESIGIEEKEEENQTEAEETEEEIKEDKKEDEPLEEVEEATKVQQKGFFARLWEWVKDLFS